MKKTSQVERFFRDVRQRDYILGCGSLVVVLSPVFLSLPLPGLVSGVDIFSHDLRDSRERSLFELAISERVRVR